MATLVAFHAHPDDESLSMGGTFARAAAEGHRTVLVVATGGEHGQVPSDLAAGESLADRRRRETEAACDALGVSRLVWLGYEDSGMTGWSQNANRGAFVNADPDEAARRLSAILDEERPEVFTTYDWHGNYGHPDHLQVHAVGHLAARRSGVEGVYEVTMNRDWFRSLVAMAREAGVPETEGFADFDADAPADDGNPNPAHDRADRRRISKHVRAVGIHNFGYHREGRLRRADLPDCRRQEHVPRGRACARLNSPGQTRGIGVSRRASLTSVGDAFLVLASRRRTLPPAKDGEGWPDDRP